MIHGGWLDAAQDARDGTPSGSGAASAPKTVAVLRALQLGDMLCAVPALRALRAGLPDAHIALIGLPWASEFVERFSHLVDELIELPGFPGLPEREPDLAAVPPFIASMQARRFDLAVQLHGDGSIVNPLVALLGARHSAGFCRPRAWRPDVATYMPYPTRASEVDRLLALMRFLRLPYCGAELEFPVHPRDEEAARGLLDEHRLGTARYAIVHAGARASQRRWPAAHFAAVADRLAEHGLVVLLTGTRTERETSAAVGAAMRHRAIDVTGRTSLGTIGALIDQAALLVCNDTGVSHIAAARRTPSVVVFSASERHRWAPADSRRHRVVSATSPDALEEALAAADELLPAPRQAARSAA